MEKLGTLKILTFLIILVILPLIVVCEIGYHRGKSKNKDMH